jgi:hypothetical protein
MINSLEIFRAGVVVGNGLVRGNRFEVEINPPAALSRINQYRLAIMCESCTLPGRQIQTIEVPYTSRQPIRVPTSFINGEVSMVFYLTNDFHAKKVFEKWINAVFDRDAYRIPFKEDYVTDVVIKVQDQIGFTKHSVKLKGAFPVSVAGAELANGNSDVLRMTVTLAYEDFETLK